MKSDEERLLDLEREMAIVKESLIMDKEFKDEIRDTFQKFSRRNEKVDEFIESELQVRKDRADFWKNQKDKLATAGIIGAVGILCSVGWYAIQQFFHHGGK